MIKSEYQAAYVQRQYYDNGHIGYAPAVLRYLKRTGQYDRVKHYVVGWFPFLMPIRRTNPRYKGHNHHAAV